MNPLYQDLDMYLTNISLTTHTMYTKDVVARFYFCIYSSTLHQRSVTIGVQTNGDMEFIIHQKMYAQNKCFSKKKPTSIRIKSNRCAKVAFFVVTKAEIEQLKHNQSTE